MNRTVCVLDQTNGLVELHISELISQCHGSDQINLYIFNIPDVAELKLPNVSIIFSKSLLCISEQFENWEPPRRKTDKKLKVMKFQDGLVSENEGAV